MESVDWDSLGNSNGQDEPPTTINDVWSNLRSAFLTVADKHAPFIQKRVRGINKCPWMNKEIKSDIRQRDFCLRKARKSNTNEDWSNYRCMRNRVTSKIKKARSAFNRKLVERNSEDPKAFWRTVKKILPGESKSASLSMKIDGDVCADKKKIADGFNKFFTGAVQCLLQEFGQIKYSAVNQSEPRVSGNKSYPEFKFQFITQNFTLSELKNLKCNKSSGMDNIPPRLLKDAAAVIAKPLTKIINTSLAMGAVPDEWKRAKVTPVFKKGKRSEMDNYRPISVLPVASNLLERAVHRQLYQFLSKHQILSPFQCGFRKNHSTESAAISFTDSIRRGMDQGLLTGAVFIDLRKAFDSVDHDIIVSKLKAAGISGTELHWFKDYLSNRTQQVNVENELSGARLITSGVPQGSILGPLLFVMLINDLPSRLNTCSTLMYADDTVLFYSSKDVNEIERALCRDLQLLESWLRDNSLFLNKSKTECVLFGTASRLSTVTSFSIYVSGSLIERVSEFKYLGVVLDKSLSWTAHVKYILGKAEKRVGMLSRIRTNVTTDTAHLIYKSFILPVIDYSDTVWNCCGKVNSDNLEKLHRRAAHLIVRNQCSDAALQSLAMESLENRRKKHVYRSVTKCMIGKFPQFFINYFNYNREITGRQTRQSNLLHLPRVRTEVAKKSFFYSGAQIFDYFKNM